MIIFVFGSNRAGAHGGGAAHDAHVLYAAEWGKGEGLTGTSYALPTKDDRLHTLPLEEVAKHVETFKQFARDNQHMNFLVTRVGCGLAGFKGSEIAPLFKDAPANCFLSAGWGDE